MKQNEALTILKSERNVFLTGQPGTGKTYLINQYIEWLIDNGRVPNVTASTGIAAIHVGGATLHSWAGVRDDNNLTAENVTDILENPWARERICKTEILIIDEISMVSANLLNAASLIASKAKGNDKPFGGIKIVVVGDFFQLPPVKGEFAFTAESWKQADFEVCYLTDQYRQADKVFNDILTGIRKGELNDEQKQILRDRVVDDVSGVDAVRLDTHNAKVDKINEMKLDRLPGKPNLYEMTADGNEKAIIALKKNCLSPERLFLKVGAPVLFTKNDKDKQWVNGSQGKVTEVMEHGIKVLTDGDEVIVGIEEWERSEGYGRNKKSIAKVRQLPVKLGYAITIHKSQGMTLDAAIIDVSNVFACGHAYVALSRVKSLDNVYFQGRLTGGFLNVDEEVQEFDKKILKA